MSVRCNLFKYSVLLAVFLFLLPTNVSAWWWNGDAQCDDVAENGVLNVMTINLLFSEIENRDERLEAIADFIADSSDPSDPFDPFDQIDVVLLQEVVGGALIGTNNSARDLKDILLNKHDLNYNLRTAFETGLPGLLAVANAILSRCEIRFSLVKRLPRATEVEFDGRVIKLGRNVMMSRLKIPGFGKLNVYNTHLCSRCDVDERDEQLEELLDFLNNVERFIPRDNPIVLGGDFNFDLFDDMGEERFLYDTIVTGEEFSDAYAAGADEPLDNLCEDEDNADEHCTVGVSKLDGPNARRIDYIFTKGFGEVIESRVVFNTLVNEDEPTVSDHAGVVTGLNLP